MKRSRCEGCGQKVLERALTLATWIHSKGGPPQWCADCVFLDPPPLTTIGAPKSQLTASRDEPGKALLREGLQRELA